MATLSQAGKSRTGVRDVPKRREFSSPFQGFPDLLLHYHVHPSAKTAEHGSAAAFIRGGVAWAASSSFRSSGSCSRSFCWSGLWEPAVRSLRGLLTSCGTNGSTTSWDCSTDEVSRNVRGDRPHVLAHVSRSRTESLLHRHHPYSRAMPAGRRAPHDPRWIVALTSLDPLD